MALQWADTFNKYGTSVATMLNGLPYSSFGGGGSSTTLVADPDPTATGNVIKIANNGLTDDNFRVSFPGGPKATMGFAYRLWLTNLPGSFLGSSSCLGWCVNDISNATQFTIEVETNGIISAYKGRRSGGVLIGSTSIPVIAPNSWNHIEVKFTISTTVGAIEVRVNGSPVLVLSNVNNQNTGNTTAAQINYANVVQTSPPSSYLKDFIIWDTTGSFNNNFIGAVICSEFYPDGDNSLTWTPSTGANGWSILDNNPPLDDAAYISAGSTLTNKFTLTNLPANVSSVRGNVIVTRARKTDSGDGNIQAGLVSGASTALGANRAITTAYTYWFDINETDPATGAAWTPVAFNSALFQLARTV